MPHAVFVFVLVLVVALASIVACLEAGRQLRRQHRGHEDPDADSGLGAIDGAVYGLMGLLLAFTFTGAAQRFEHQRELIVAETNAMGTVWLRIDLLPKPAQPAIREELRRYVDSRIRSFSLLSEDAGAAQEEAGKASALQSQLWKTCVAVAQEQSSTTVTSLLVPALNEMIDLTTSRQVAMLTHPPVIIYIALVFLVLASSVLAGYGMGKSSHRDWAHILVYAAALSIAMYVILDLDYPRVGLIQISNVDQVMVDLRRSMD